MTGYELVLDGVPVLPDSRCLTEFERKFNIHTGELVITSTYELESGASFCLTDRRFASMENEHLFVQSIGITMQKGCIKHGGICTGIDGQQTNSGVSHFKKVNCRVYDRKYLHVEGYLEEDTLSILEGVSYTGEEEEAVFTLKRRGITGRYFFSIPDGGTWEFTKYVYIQNEKDSLGLDRQKKLLEKCSEAGYADVFLKHKKIMQDIWRQARIEIDGASPEEEAAVSFAQYHLLGMMPGTVQTAVLRQKDSQVRGTRDMCSGMRRFLYYRFSSMYFRRQPEICWNSGIKVWTEPGKRQRHMVTRAPCIPGRQP